ncbi:MAG: pesticin [Acidobacteriia bacterium]|nr:pesticin [Terriglobia bacterium]
MVIKKYGNRRLYDTSASRYINLDDIARLVRNGKDVRVIDAKTGDDLTRVTLTQIIVEDAKEQPAGLPLELLRQLIVATDHVGREFVMWYLKSAFSTYQKMQNALQGGLTEVRSAALSPLDVMKDLIQGKTAEQTDSGELRRSRRKKPTRRGKRGRTTR